MNKAQAIINKRIVIGLTYYEHDGKLVDQEQMYGKVASVNDDCVKVVLEGKRKGETISLPRNLRAFKQAEPGVYTLKSTGEEVENPDYTTVWDITKAPPQKD